MKIFQLLKYTGAKGKNFIKTTFQESKNIVDNIFAKPSKTSQYVQKSICNEREIAGTIDIFDFEEGFKKIKFKKAKSLEEAKMFAQQELGISRFDFTDLEMANQFNLSTTRALNMTECKELIADEVVMARLSDMKFLSHLSKEELACIPATTLHLKNGGKRIVFSLDYLDQLDDTIKKGINSFKKFGQVSKDKNGLYQIDLKFDYQYKHTLNRYFKLYQQGKLTSKAKIDFHSLLDAAIDEQKTLLTSKSAMNATGRPRRAIGMDKYVLHEDGHVLYSKTSGKIKSEQKFSSDEERKAIQNGISTYAADSPGEMMAEKIAESLSGATFSNEIETIFEKYFGKRFEIKKSDYITTKAKTGSDTLSLIDEFLKITDVPTHKGKPLKVSG